MDAKISVIIPCFNYSRYLMRSINSIRDQRSTDWELIVVDDGSTDSSRRLAQDFADDHPELAVTLLFKRNGGLGRARNAGISVARGEYIVCLDADDYFSDTALEHMANKLDDDDSVDAVRPTLRAFGIADYTWSHSPYNFQDLKSRNVAPYSSMFRRRAWVQVGGYNEMMPSYEDWDFWIALGKLGGKMSSAAEALHYYRTSRDGMLAQHIHRDLELRATIVNNHPEVYDRYCRELASLVMAGEHIDDRLTETRGGIFGESLRAYSLKRHQDLS
ncbi:glycosyltransferase family 2 protein [Streptomyces sp. NPDC058297]|uniref:glycosyltransferase family 2 protein n=1 Tax=Streptomyces sp. NPDC058297 TaxID=3346433 RepID=UPI0036E8B011